MFFDQYPLNSFNNSIFSSVFSENQMKKNIPSTFFSQQLLKWYNQNQRILPWRETKNPYHIWLSEIILQQTRVDQGLPYYLRFINSYPNIQALANAPEDDVLKLWQGLGYYSRARNLHATAKYIITQHEGIFPSEYKEILKLKGVGKYTAAAIASFAYDQPYATVDGNVYRVISRIFGIQEYIDTSKGQKIFEEIASELLDKDNAATYNQSIMDFGATQCTPKAPKCSDCPFSDTCYAYDNNQIDKLPRKQGKVKTRNRHFNYLDIRTNGYTYLKKRDGNDIWKGLYEFPLIETDDNVSIEELITDNAVSKIIAKLEDINIVKEYSCKHVLSHQIIHASFYQIETNSFTSEEFIKIKEEELTDYAIPKMIDNYLNKI